MKNHFMINKLPLYGLNSIAGRSFTAQRSSILNSIFRRSVNSPESGAIVHINSGEPANHLVINNILLNIYPKLLGGSVPKDLNAKAILEATSLGHVTHARIIRVVAVIKGDNPMNIFPFWNGKHLDRWMVYLGHDGKDHLQWAIEILTTQCQPRKPVYMIIC